MENHHHMSKPGPTNLANASRLKSPMVFSMFFSHVFSHQFLGVPRFLRTFEICAAKRVEKKPPMAWSIPAVPAAFVGRFSGKPDERDEWWKGFQPQIFFRPWAPGLWKIRGYHWSSDKKITFGSNPTVDHSILWLTWLECSGNMVE